MRGAELITQVIVVDGPVLTYPPSSILRALSSPLFFFFLVLFTL